MSTGENGIPSSDGIVSVDDLMRARDEVHRHGIEQSSAALAQIEPELSGFITAAVQCAAGQLLMADVDPNLARSTAEGALGAMLTCVEALRRAQRRLWDAMDDPPNPTAPQAKDDADDLPF